MPDDPRNHISHFANISEYCNLLGMQVAHPLVAVIDRSEFKKNFQNKSTVSFGFYFVSLKEDKHCHFQYGRNEYDYQAGTLVFTAPGQIINMSDEQEYDPKGLALLFHPDLLIGSSLKYTLKIYSFFEYDVYEALHLSPEEKQLARECFRNINKESAQAKDKYSQKLITANLSLFLDYCLRFYDRQFSSRVKTNNGVIARFDQLLTDLLFAEGGIEDGIPSVTYFAERLHLSTNYFGDLVKKETGRTALDHIKEKLFIAAKEKMNDRQKTISQIAGELGFAYPQHFTRFFKRQCGILPSAFKKRN